MSSQSLSESLFGTMPDGRQAHVFSFKNSNGAEAKVSDYGGTILSISVPDRDGRFADVVLGCDTLESYMKESPYFGAIIGRCANRIAFGKLPLGGKEISLPVNENNQPNHLHGGVKGFDKALWTAKVKKSKGGPKLELKYLSPDGEEGYPGNLSATAVYSFGDDNALKLELTAKTDKLTVCNITNHAYFNLAGKGDVLNHEAEIPSSFITPSNEHFIPTGELMKVEGTPFDFNKRCRIGARIGQSHQQLKFGLGYDHNWVVRKEKEGETSLAARVFDPSSGRVVEAFTNQPGIQFYSGNFLDGSVKGKGRVFEYRNAFCLEPQRFPDAPHHPNFPSIELKPGEVYKNVIIYKFSVEK